MLDQIKISGKQKKIIAISFIAIVILVLILFAVKRYRAASAQSNIDSPGTDKNSSTGSGSSLETEFKPGTPLKRIGKSDEAQELQKRYAGMSKEDIVFDYIIWRFEKDSGYLNFLKGKATEEGKSLAEVKRWNAIYLLDNFNVPLA